MTGKRERLITSRAYHADHATAGLVARARLAPQRRAIVRSDDEKYLVGQGVDGDRIQTASQGEDNASGNPDKWPRDRHVQVELVR